MNIELFQGRLVISSGDLMLLGFFAAFLVVVAMGPRTIASLHRLKFGQAINADAPETHAAKSGTPTMGGILFVYGAAVAVAIALLLSRVDPDSVLFRQSELLRDLAAVSMVFLAHVGIGFADDYLSIKRGKNLGLKARYKLLWQFLIAAVFGCYIYLVSPADSAAAVGIFGIIVHVSRLVYCLAVIVVMMGMSNCTNLTDGLDGLASGLAIMALIGLSLIVVGISPGAAYFGWALAGACLGFLVYNGHPARVFMGDTGSLAIGASLTAMAVIGHAEIFMLLLAIMFLAEGLSVALQVVSFKTTGKRIFKMSPLHHHFELAGWPETQVVMRFWIVGLLAFCLALAMAGVGPASLTRGL